MSNKGYFQLFRWGRIPFRAHWSLPLVFVMFSGFRIAPGAWLGIALLIIIHELGHAFMARRYGLRVLAIEMTGYGGLCRHEAAPTTRQEAIVAWGGVLSQSIVLVPALFVRFFGDAPSNAFSWDLLDALSTSNAILIGLNLLPFPPLDGATAWKLFSKKGPRSEKKSNKRAGRRRAKSVTQPQRSPLRASPRELSRQEKQRISDQVRDAIDRGLKDD